MKILKKVMSVMAAGMMSVMLSFGAMAAFGEVVYKELPVKVAVNVDAGSFSGETFTVKLSSRDGAPMPDDGVYEKAVTLSADKLSETVKYGSIHYTAAGTYVYDVTISRAGTDSYLTLSSSDALVLHVEVENSGEVQTWATSGTDKKQGKSELGFSYSYNCTSSGRTTTGGGSGSGGGGGTTEWHSVTPQGSEDSGQVLGASRGPVGEIIEAVAESPVGQVLGATRKAVQTGDSSMMVIMGLGFVACAAVLIAWERRIFHKEKSETN